ncbi:P-loop containing nucleoside triphosphate hydrolase protein [Gloeophyllum trabeum ATCC 11539]|uniref:small monomeric GTPase n=1 Tax=Gloeophyllum trabeum (strain ATCC 11539 / FP-39264 / Madison 617) TaxID=670483 RepID=S7PZW7_GLOTA|nr:P-loop containing nucleoside triphosphate hydrolase protein [Gloeophyllum trabeum ATCC 11539]EPQ52832.1 P-loop containing nucleoside triphosphate hydrolase protein [Gloeophyllum trabeum ATCC 11539]
MSASIDIPEKVAEKPNSREHWKICILGDMGVGKTALAEGFLGRAADSGSPEGLAIAKEITVDGRTSTIEIFDPVDTDPSEPLVFRPGQGIQEADAFILLYSITFRGSFDRLTSFHSHIHEQHTKSQHGPPFILVGNMSDMDESDPEAREVNTDEAEELAKKWGCAFYETSVKANLRNVDNVFEELVRETRKKAAADGMGKGNEKREEDTPGKKDEVEDEDRHGSKCCGRGCVIM